MATNPKTINRTSGKVIAETIVVKLTGKGIQAKLDQAKVYFNGLDTNKKKTFDELLNIGLIGVNARKSVDNNNKAVKAWRELHFPNMQARYLTNAIWLYTNRVSVKKAFTKMNMLNNEWHNPEAVYKAYTRLTKPKATNDKPKTKTGNVNATGTDKNLVESLAVMTPEKQVKGLTLDLSIIIQGINLHNYDKGQLSDIIQAGQNMVDIAIDELDEIRESEKEAKAD